MGEKQSRWHTAMAPHCFSLSKRLGTARPSSPSIGSVLGLMLYTPLHTWTAVFTSLCVSDAFAVAVSYYKKMRCFFFCLFSAFLVPPVSPAPWYLSPPLGAQRLLSGHHKAGFGRNKIFPPFPSCDPSPKMKADCSFLTNSLYLALPLPNVSCCQWYHTVHSIAHASATLFCSGVHAF